MCVAEISCAVWSVSQRGRSVRRLRADEAARIARGACVSPCALVLALLYLERLQCCNPDYLAAAPPAELFLVSLVTCFFNASKSSVIFKFQSTIHFV